jgi:hypothetical protein
MKSKTGPLYVQSSKFKVDPEYSARDKLGFGALFHPDARKCFAKHSFLSYHLHAVKDAEPYRLNFLMPPSDLYNVARNHDLFKARKIRLQALWNFKSQLGPRARLGNAIVNPPSPARRSKILKNLALARRRRVGMGNLISVRCAHTP